MQRIVQFVSSFLCFACLLFYSLFAHAAQENTDPSSKYNGFYLGAAGGLGMLTSISTLDGSAQFVDTFLSGPSGYPIFHTVSFDETGDDDTFGAAGRISAGWGRCIGECWYTGLELSVTGVSGTAKESFVEDIEYFDAALEEVVVTVANSLEIKVKAEYGLDFKTGFFLSEEFFIFARAGVSLATIDLTSTIALHSTSEQIIGAANQEVTDSSTHWGLRLGVGGEQKITEKISLVFEYTYTSYGVSNLDQEVVTYDQVIPPQTKESEGLMTSNGQVDLTQQVLLLGLNYYF